MKTKHLQKIFISGIYAMLISLSFFLSPSSVKAQGVILDCVNPPPGSSCCVNHAYEDLVTDCRASAVVNMDGYILATQNGINWDEVANVKHTRLMATVKEIGDDVVELRTYVEGPLLSTGLFQDIIYNRAHLEVTENGGGQQFYPSNTALQGNHWDNNIGYQSSMMKWIDMPFSSPWSYTYNIRALDSDNTAAGQYGWLHISLNGGMTGTLIVGDKEVVHLHTIYFKKVISGLPLDVADLGFFSVDASMIDETASQDWALTSAIGNIALIATPSPSSYAGNQWMSIPSMHEYRYPSSVITNDPVLVTETKAVLSGTFKQGNYPSSQALPVATSAPYTAGNYNNPLANFNLQPQGFASQDEILTYGFIYTAAPGFDDTNVVFDSYEDFEKSFIVDYNGEYEIITVAKLLAWDGFQLDMEDFYIEKFTTAVGGDYTLEVPVNVSAGTYKYWVFSLNSYNGIEPFLNVGEVKEFAPSSCFDEPDLGFVGDLCTDYALMVVNNYGDFLDPSQVGAGDVIADWYWIDPATGDETHIYHGFLEENFDIAGMPGGFYRLMVTVPLDDDGTYCETEATYLVNPCGGPFIITQTVDPELLCSGEDVTFTVTVENYGTVPRTDVIVKITPDFPGLELFAANESSGTYNDATGEWTISTINPGPNSIVTLTLDYTATNTGDVPFVTLLHYAEITEFESFVVPDDAIINSSAYVTVIPEPVAEPVGPLYFCAGTTVDAIDIDGVYTYFDYTVDGTGINLLDGDKVTQIPSFTTDNVTDPEYIEIEVIPYYLYDGKECEGDPMTIVIEVYPNPTVTVPTNQTFCDGETININLRTGNESDLEYQYYWERIVGEDLGLTDNYGTNTITGTAKNTGNAPLQAIYQVTAYYTDNGIECWGATDNFIITVNPKPVIAPVADGKYCVGDEVAAYTFTGSIPGATYFWELVGTPGVPGIPTSGYDVFPAFTATNPGTTSLVCNYKVTASYSFANGTCTDDTTFTITINPMPTMAEISNTTYCYNVAAADIDLTIHNLSPTTGTDVEWEFVFGSASLGIPATSGKNIIPWMTNTMNNTNTVLTAIYKVTPVFDGCYGESQYISISVNPELTVDVLEDIVVCSPTAIPAIYFTGQALDAAYEWTATAVDVPDGDPANPLDIGMPATSGHGHIPAFTANNTTETPIIVTIETVAYMDGSFGRCESVKRYFDIVVNPVLAPAWQEDDWVVCVDEEVLIPFWPFGSPEFDYEVEATGDVLATNFQWDGVGAVDFIAANATSGPLTVHVKVTPVIQHPGNFFCYGEPMYFDITVNPEVEMPTLVDVEYCAGQNAPAYVFNGFAEGVIYEWENVGDPIPGIPDKGFGDIPAFLAINPGTTPIVGEFNVTATLFATDDPCMDDGSFEITINPVPVMNQLQDVIACNGDNATTVTFTSNTASTDTKYDIFINDPETTGMVVVGTGDDNVVITPVNTTSAPIILTVTVTPIYEGATVDCAGDPVTFTITVNPTQNLTQPVDQIVCVGDMTAPITFGSNLVTWEVDPAGAGATIGMPESGTGDIPSFKVLTDIEVTIIVTGTITCQGNTIDPVTITGVERPVMVQLEDITVCNDDPIVVPQFASNATLPSYEWRFVGGYAVIGPGTLDGIGNITVSTAENTETTPIAGVYGVKVTENGVCESEEMFFTVFVNPTPEVDPPASFEVCEGTAIPAYTFTGNTFGATYYWEQTNNGSVQIPGLEGSGYDVLPAFTALTMANAPMTLEYTVTPFYEYNGVSCEGDTETFEITIYPTPVMDPVDNIVTCNGIDDIEVYFWAPTWDATYYEWYVDNPANAAIIGFPATGTAYDNMTGDPQILFDATNTTDHPVIVTVTVTPKVMGGQFIMECAGEPVTFTITVNPVPVADQPADGEYCHGTAVPAYTFTGNVPGATYYWAQTSGPSIAGLPPDGYNILPAFTAVNTGYEPIELEFVVAPYFEYDGQACEGQALDWTIIINPVPVMVPVENVIVCVDEPVEIEFQSSTDPNTLYDWYVDNTSNADAIGMSALTSPSSMISFVSENATNHPITVVVTVIPSSVDGGDVLCAGEPVTFSITVNPEPIVDAIEDAVYCDGTAVPAYTFTGNTPGAVYKWEQTNYDPPSLVLPGVPKEGYNVLPAFTAVNTTDEPIVLTYEVVAFYEECEGTKKEFTITINPMPVMVPVENVLVCDTKPVEIEFESTGATYVQYAWYVDNTINANAIGMDLGGDNDSPSDAIAFTAKNDTDNPITVIVTVTPSSVDGSDILCTGEPVTFSITVSPVPEVFSLVDQIVCVGDMTAEINFSATGAPAGTKFYWENDNTSIGLDAAGEGNIPSFEVWADVVATITVHAEFPNGAEPCVGSDTTFTITGVERPVMTPIVDVTVCDGEDVEVQFASTATNPVYEWRLVSGAEIANPMPVNGGPTDVMIAFTGVNTGATPLSAVFAVKVSELGYCESEEIFFTVTVNPIPVVIPPADDVIYCDGTAVPAYTFQGNVTGATYYWLQTNYNDYPVNGLPQDGYNVIPAFTAENKTNEPIVLEYAITPTFEYLGTVCEGDTEYFTITINPVPTMYAVSNVIVCDGEDVDIMFTASTFPNTMYDWYVDNEASADLIGMDLTLVPTDYGIEFKAENTTDSPIVVFVTVIPWSVNPNDFDELLCEGTPVTFSITVNPTPVADAVGDQIYCHGTQVPLHLFTGNVVGATYHWVQTNYDDVSVSELPEEGYNVFPAFTAINLEDDAIVLEYAVIPTFEMNGVICEGDTIEFTITLHPAQIVDPLPNLVFCAGDDVDAIEFTGAAGEYRWIQISGDVITDPNDVDLFAGGEDVFPGFETVNDGYTALVAVIQVTPWTEDGYCSGDPITFTITVKPTPTVYGVGDQLLCANEYTTDIIFDGDTDETIYNWEVVYEPADGFIGLQPTSGIGNILSFKVINTTDAQIKATFTVTPSFKGDPADACPGKDTTFTITVNPIPTVDPIANMMFCEAAETGVIELTGNVTDAKYLWKQISGDVITNDIDLFAGNIGDIPSFETINLGNTVLVAVIQVTPWTADGFCEGEPIEFTISIVPTPTVDMPQFADTEYCAGESIFVEFTGNTPGTIFTWTNDETGIGLPEAGVSDILEFTATNDTDEPLVATIKVVPIIIQGNPDDACVGDSIEFTLTVYPQPVMDPVANVTDVCVGDEVNIEFTSNLTNNVVYNWYVNNEPAAIAMGMGNLLDGINGDGDIIFDATNGTMAPITVQVTVIPSFVNDGEELCPGEPVVFTITVDPTPTVAQVEDIEVCAGTALPTIHFQGNVPGTQFMWKITETEPEGAYIGLGDEGWGDITSFITQNDEGVPIVVTVTVYPIFGSGISTCEGAEEMHFTITVDPMPVIDPVIDQTYCAGTIVEGFEFTNSTVEPDYVVYTWTQISGQSIGKMEVEVWDEDLQDWIWVWVPLPTSGTGDFPTFTAVNDGINPMTAEYEVIATVGVCESAPIYFTITVVPTPHLDPVANRAYCAGTQVDEYCFSGTVPGATYVWTFMGGDNIAGPSYPGSGTGCMPPFTAIDNNTDHVLTAHYQVVVTYMYNGVACGGEMQEFTISVLPKATITNLDNKVYCHNEWVDDIAMFEGVATRWEWIQIAGPNIGDIPNNGEVPPAFPQFYAKNYGNTPIEAVYKVIPYYEVEGVSCSGVEGYFTITVNPTPAFTTTVPDEIVYCNNTHVSKYEFDATYGALIRWARTDMPGGANIGDIPSSGMGPLPEFYTANDTNDILTAYFKVWAEYRNNDGTICASDEYDFSISVLPTVEIDINALDKVFCHNEYVPAQHFTSNIPGNSLIYVEYEWKQVGGDYIGLDDVYGINTIPGFTAYNPGDTPVTAQYEVTATAKYAGVICGSTIPVTFRLTVNPKPVLTSPADAGNLCSGSIFYYIAETNVDNIDFTWERPAIEGINDNVAGSGTGAIINERLVNTTTTAIEVEYHFVMYGTCTDPNEIFVVKVLVTPDFALDFNLLETEIVTCNTSTSFDIAYEDIGDAVGEYKITFADDALPSMNIFVALPANTITVTMPEGVKEGEYPGIITIRGGVDCEGGAIETDYPFTLIVKQGTVIVGDLEDAAICIANDLVLTIDAIGCDLSYTWYRNNQVIATTTTGVYIIPNASEVDAGNYYVVVTGCCGEPVTSRAAIVGGLIVGQKWDDVLYVDNSKDAYAAYQWYRILDDGRRIPIDGATSQYFSEQPLHGTYMVVVMDALGNIMFESCEFTPTVITKNTISIYPNPVAQHGTLTIVMDMDPEMISGSRIDVYDIVGKLSRTVVVDGRTTNITMQMVPGSYVVRITNVSGEILKSEKVIVR